ncbi:MAG: hypothetical protein QXW97_03590 [Candidatus Pacearchaeota archaeon]
MKKNNKINKKDIERILEILEKERFFIVFSRKLSKKDIEEFLKITKSYVFESPESLEEEINRQHYFFEQNFKIYEEDRKFFCNYFGINLKDLYSEEINYDDPELTQEDLKTFGHDNFYRKLVQLRNRVLGYLNRHIDEYEIFKNKFKDLYKEIKGES